MSKTRQQYFVGKVVGSGGREGATSRGVCHGFPPPPETTAQVTKSALTSHVLRIQCAQNNMRNYGFVTFDCSWKS